MIARIFSAAITGIETQLVHVEVDIQERGLPGWNMVGLLETAVKEARDRVLPAIRNSGYDLRNRRTIINLAPGHIKKSGAHFDLPIAVGILIARGVCKPTRPLRYLFAGELSLTGKLLPINAALLLTMEACNQDLEGVIIPAKNVEEANLIDALDIFGFDSLAEVIAFLNEGLLPQRTVMKKPPRSPKKPHDFSDVQGHAAVKRGLEIAAAGGHHVAMIGPPGSGKTMLAERVPTILPPLSKEEKIETMKILSVHGLLTAEEVDSFDRPFRAPHHSASYAGLINEMTLAHNGVLFLDEFGEFRRDALEMLRQPLEAGSIRIVRAQLNALFPARLMLISSMNPCNCGYYGHPRRECMCSFAQLQNYRRKVSGPLMDRIDIVLEVEPVAHQELLSHIPREPSAAIRRRIVAARKIQLNRLGPEFRCNVNIPPRDLGNHCRLQGNAISILEKATTRFSFSARAIHRVLKLSRTIADLESAEEIKNDHIVEALQYRPQEGWLE